MHAYNNLHQLRDLEFRTYIGVLENEWEAGPC